MRNPLKLKKSKARRFVELQDSGFSAAQFETQEHPIPWNAIGLATLLFLAGGGLLAVGILIKIGQLVRKIGSQEVHLLLFSVVSCLFQVSFLFSFFFDELWIKLIQIIGSYHLYIAYYAYYKYPGYDFSLIPDWD
ncbi:unnamed protein product [Rhizopus stolonifer]